MDKLTDILIKHKFQKCKTRKNILNEGDKEYEGFNLGYVRLIPWQANKFGYNIQISRQTEGKKAEEIFNLSKKIADENIPDFKYSSIQYNKNYKIKKHKDKRNMGVSYIVGLGDYEGGELLIYYDGKDKPPTAVDIKNKFYTFDGSKYYHEVADFTGNRISLVYYNIIRNNDIKKEDYLLKNGCKLCDKKPEDPPELILNPEDFLKFNDNKKVIFDSDYYVAIPSYQRAETLLKKTLPTLLNASVSPSVIYIFVANDEEYMKYKAVIPDDYYKDIIVGEKGIKNQRIFISNFFPENTKIVSIDDDVEKVYKKVDGKLIQINQLDNLIRKNFDLITKTVEFEGIHLWGVYPTPNSLWMKEDNITTDLRFCIGVFYGYINRHDSSLYPKTELKEDIELSILHYLKDDGICRFNNISFKTKFLAPGGCGTDRFEGYKKAQEYLCEKYPDYCKPKFRKDGTPEIFLRKKKINK
tara:strand:+ start:1062 stop:2468 length:1407 start_codon:yes stop_codon:yes gene_type:complete